MVEVRKRIERFIELFNQPGSPVYEAYADDVDWVFVSGGSVANTGLTSASELAATDMPIGVSKGREQLFHDLRLVRGITKEQQQRGEFVVPPKPGMIVDIRVKPRHITAEGNLGVLECVWSGKPVRIDGIPGDTIRAHMVFILRFTETGLISMDHDYFMLLP
jgi:hypothetical protein